MMTVEIRPMRVRVRRTVRPRWKPVRWDVTPNTGPGWTATGCINTPDDSDSITQCQHSTGQRALACARHRVDAAVHHLQSAGYVVTTRAPETTL